MAFLIIDKPIEDIISGLQADKAMLEQAYDISPEDSVESSLEIVADRLRCAEMYKRMYDKKSEYEKFKYLQWKKPKEYIKRCKEIVRDIKGIDFDTRAMGFRVRVRRNGKQEYFGTYDTPQDATEILFKLVGSETTI